MLIRILLIFVGLPVSGLSQENTLHYSKIKDNFTWRTIKQEHLDSFYFNLQPVRTSNYKAHIRISLTSQIFDFYSTDNVNFKGWLTNYITEYKTVWDKECGCDKEEENQFVFETLSLNPSLVIEMVNKLQKTRMHEVPTDTLIREWKNLFLHCNTIEFFFKYSSNYYSQSFSCINGQNDSVPYSLLIKDNYQTLKLLFNPDSLYALFESRLIRGRTYSSDGYRMNYKFTMEEAEALERDKPRREYLKAISDTVDSYISYKLNMSGVNFSEIESTRTFWLRFGTNGKLEKVYVQKRDRAKLGESLGLGDYLEDKSELRHTRSLIRKMFKDIDLGFLELKYPLTRNISFGYDSKFYLGDPTIYY